MKNTGKIYNEQEWQGINTSDFIYAVNIDNCSVTISEYKGKGGNVIIPALIDCKLVTGIDFDAFENCTSLTCVTIPNSVTRIGNGVFSECTGLTVVTIPDSVISIWIAAFYGCTSLTSIIIPDSVTRIGKHAFANCENLTCITIPNSVKEIGELSFYGCESLTKVTFERADTVIDNDNTFPNGSSMRTAYTAGGIGTYTRASESDNWEKK
jgi:hypothetical protein